MLENLAGKKSLTSLSTPRCRSCAAFGRAAHRRALEFPRRPARAAFSAEKRVAEHSGDGIFSAQEMHLKAVCLFFRARLGIDAADIGFRIGIGSSSHEPCLTTTSNNAGINESRCFIAGGRFFPAAASPMHAIFFQTRRPAVARSTGAVMRASR